jgi:hypothetical protein
MDDSLFSLGLLLERYKTLRQCWWFLKRALGNWSTRKIASFFSRIMHTLRWKVCSRKFYQLLKAAFVQRYLQLSLQDGTIKREAFQSNECQATWRDWVTQGWWPSSKIASTATLIVLVPHTVAWPYCRVAPWLLMWTRICSVILCHMNGRTEKKIEGCWAPYLALGHDWTVRPSESDGPWTSWSD